MGVTFIDEKDIVKSQPRLGCVLEKEREPLLRGRDKDSCCCLGKFLLQRKKPFDEKEDKTQVRLSSFEYSPSVANGHLAEQLPKRPYEVAASEKGLREHTLVYNKFFIGDDS